MSEIAKELDLMERNKNLIYMNLDLNDLDNVRNFCFDFKKQYNRLDILMNNAGVFNKEYIATKQGFESHLGVNHLGMVFIINDIRNLFLQFTNFIAFW